MRGLAHTALSFSGFGTEAALREVAQTLPAAVFTTDADGTVTYWNPAAERITGWSPAEAVGQRCTLFAGGSPAKVCTLRVKDGRELLIVKNAVPLYGSEGELVGALETFTEVVARAEPSRRAGAPDDFFGLVGDHPVMLELYEIIAAVALSDAAVMLLGESGAGKRLVAEALHELSSRAQAPFVRASCAGSTESILESELFGRARGRGRFEEAQGGTLLLDEIGDLPLPTQGKLLRVIEERRLDVRLVCSTHRDLHQLVAGGRFRADLYFRLNVIPIAVPPLREHLSDLPRIARRLLEDARISDRALEVLSAYAWPGNVRELRNALEYAALRANGGEIRPEHLPADVRRAGGEPLPPRNDERAALLAILSRQGWNRAAAARELGISRVTLWKRMKKLGIEGPAK